MKTGTVASGKNESLSGTMASGKLSKKWHSGQHHAKSRKWHGMIIKGGTVATGVSSSS